MPASEQNAMPTDSTSADASAAEAVQAPVTDGEASAEAVKNEAAVSEASKTDGGDEQKPADGAPETYAFVAPEGAEFDPKTIESFSEVAKELNMTQEAAQKILDKMGPAMAQRQAEAVQEIHAQWEKEARADTEFGGAALDANLGIAKHAMEVFGTPKLTALLNETGLGNHPEMIRLLVRAGKAISNDAFVSGGPNNAPEVSLAQRMYDGMNP